MVRIATGLALALTLASTPVHADTLHNIGTALDFAGFDARGSQNPLSGGADLLITRQFNGNLFDFGATELALQGPLSLQMSTGGRLVPGFDVEFTTALNGQNAASPLNYTYFSDVGPQSTTVTGSMLIDGNFRINALGFYDLTLSSSTRNTVNREGIVTETTTMDSDIGPINVSGNIFADALAALVDPEGSENPFTELSKLIESSFVPATEAGHNLPYQNVAARTNQDRAVVPEPTVLVLLLLGLPVIVNRTWRVW